MVLQVHNQFDKQTIKQSLTVYVLSKHNVQFSQLIWQCPHSLIYKHIYGTIDTNYKHTVTTRSPGTVKFPDVFLTLYSTPTKLLLPTYLTVCVMHSLHTV